MKRAEPIERRWREGARIPEEARAAELLGAVTAPRPLDPVQLRRIEARLASGAPVVARATGRRLAWVAAAGLVLGVASWQVPRSRRGSIDRAVANQTELPRRAPLDQVTPAVGSSAWVASDHGQPEVAEASAASEVAAGASMVAAQSSAQLEIDSEQERVACFTAAAEVAWSEDGKMLLPGASPSTPLVKPEVRRAPGPVPIRPPAHRFTPPRTGSTTAVERSPAIHAAAPPAPPTPPAAKSESPLGVQSALLADALRLLRREHAPAAALELLDQHRRRFPDSPFAPEVERIRAEALRSIAK